MRVRVKEKTKVFHGHVPVELEKGQEVDGSLAELLATRAPKKVTRLDEPEPEAPDDDPDSDPDSPDGGSGDPDEKQEHTSPGEFDPNATAADIVAWVGEDPDRAATALEAEQAKESPRKTLVKQLEKLAETGQ